MASSSDRRTFLRTAGIGAAAVGVTALVGQPAQVAGAAVTTTAPSATPAVSGPRAAASGSMVAYIDDAATGRIAVMVEGREVTITDHRLVATLADALHSSPKV